MDLSQQNFGEPAGVSHSETAHIEYIYRMANKILTGSPDGMVDGQLVGFSLEQAIRFPDVPQKTDTELSELLQHSGVWEQTSGTNKQRMLERLAAPVTPDVAT